MKKIFCSLILVLFNSLAIAQVSQEEVFILQPQYYVNDLRDFSIVGKDVYVTPKKLDRFYASKGHTHKNSKTIAYVIYDKSVTMEHDYVRACELEISNSNGDKVEIKAKTLENPIVACTVRPIILGDPTSRYELTLRNPTPTGKK